MNEFVDDYQLQKFPSGQLFESVLNFFTDDGWAFEELESKKVLKLAVALENGNYECYAITDEESHLFIFVSLSPVKVVQQKRLAICEFIVRANYGLKLGHFDMDFRDGEIGFMTSVIAENNQLSYGLIKDLVYLNINIMDQYYPGLMKIIYSQTSAEMAIAEIENNIA